jgi:hypothetical protein
MRVEKAVTVTVTPYGYTKSWNIFVDYVLSTIFISASASRNVEVRWDPAKTSIVSARVRAVVDVNTVAIGWSVSFNGRKVIDTPWAPAHAEKDADVTSLLINGINTVTIELGKMYPWIGEAKGRFTVTLDVTFEGEEPSVSPPTAPPVSPWEWLSQNWPWLAIGAGGLLVAAYVYRSFFPPAPPVMVIGYPPAPAPTPAPVERR